MSILHKKNVAAAGIDFAHLKSNSPEVARILTTLGAQASELQSKSLAVKDYNNAARNNELSVMTSSRPVMTAGFDFDFMGKANHISNDVAEAAKYNVLEALNKEFGGKVIFYQKSCKFFAFIDTNAPPEQVSSRINKVLNDRSLYTFNNGKETLLGNKGLPTDPAKMVSANVSKIPKGSHSGQVVEHALNQAKAAMETGGGAKATGFQAVPEDGIAIKKPSTSTPPIEIAAGKSAAFQKAVKMSDSMQPQHYEEYLKKLSGQFSKETIEVLRQNNLDKYTRQEFNIYDENGKIIHRVGNKAAFKAEIDTLNGSSKANIERALKSFTPDSPEHKTLTSELIKPHGSELSTQTRAILSRFEITITADGAAIGAQNNFKGWNGTDKFNYSYVCKEMQNSLQKKYPGAKITTYVTGGDEFAFKVEFDRPLSGEQRAAANIEAQQAFSEALVKVNEKPITVSRKDVLNSFVKNKEFAEYYWDKVKKLAAQEVNKYMAEHGVSRQAAEKALGYKAGVDTVTMKNKYFPYFYNKAKINVADLATKPQGRRILKMLVKEGLLSREAIDTAKKDGKAVEIIAKYEDTPPRRFELLRKLSILGFRRSTASNAAILPENSQGLNGKDWLSTGDDMAQVSKALGKECITPEEYAKTKTPQEGAQPNKGLTYEQILKNTKGGLDGVRIALKEYRQQYRLDQTIANILGFNNRVNPVTQDAPEGIVDNRGKPTAEEIKKAIDALPGKQLLQTEYERQRTKGIPEGQAIDTIKNLAGLSLDQIARTIKSRVIDDDMASIRRAHDNTSGNLLITEYKRLISKENLTPKQAMQEIKPLAEKLANGELTIQQLAKKLSSRRTRLKRQAKNKLTDFSKLCQQNKAKITTAFNKAYASADRATQATLNKLASDPAYGGLSGMVVGLTAMWGTDKVLELMGVEEMNPTIDFGLKILIGHAANSGFQGFLAKRMGQSAVSASTTALKNSPFVLMSLKATGTGTWNAFKGLRNMGPGIISGKSIQLLAKAIGADETTALVMGEVGSFATDAANTGYLFALKNKAFKSAVEKSMETGLLHAAKNKLATEAAGKALSFAKKLTPAGVALFVTDLAATGANAATGTNIDAMVDSAMINYLDTARSSGTWKSASHTVANGVAKTFTFIAPSMYNKGKLGSIENSCPNMRKALESQYIYQAINSQRHVLSELGRLRAEPGSSRIRDIKCRAFLRIDEIKNQLAIVKAVADAASSGAVKTGETLTEVNVVTAVTNTGREVPTDQQSLAAITDSENEYIAAYKTTAVPLEQTYILNQELEQMRMLVASLDSKEGLPPKLAAKADRIFAENTKKEYRTLIAQARIAEKSGEQGEYPPHTVQQRPYSQIPRALRAS
ncbi:hypothetical protein ACFL4D_02480 [Candidatus Margulisiibacteriota bacterium]